MIINYSIFDSYNGGSGDISCSVRVDDNKIIDAIENDSLHDFIADELNDHFLYMKTQLEFDYNMTQIADECKELLCS